MQAVKAASWIKQHFGAAIETVLHGTAYDINLVLAIAAQETAYRWLLWIDKYSVDTILSRCIGDASGDFHGTHRSAFPKNAGEFHDRYGDSFTDMLISEGNKMRAMPQPDEPNGYHPWHFLYKGYGIFQYDLQNVLTDEDFFRNKLWFYFDECLKRLISELNEKAKKHSDLFSIVKAYNGSGAKAEMYSKNVMEFKKIIEV